MNEDLPASLNAAIATESAWLQGWVAVLIIVNLASILFVVWRDAGHWRVRLEPLAILMSFFVASASMGWIYEQFGYVRLLGLAHLVFWGPVFGWILYRRAEIGTTSPFGKYAHVYLVIAGISLVIDSIDVLRYLVGDGQLLNR